MSEESNQSQSGEQEQSGSMFGSGTTNETNAGGTSESSTDGGWKYSENVSGEGDKPDWYHADKYKTVEEQAKGYNELRKKLSDWTGAPEEYSLSKEKFKDVDIDSEHPLLKNLKQWGKSSNLNQEGFDGIVKLYTDFEQGAIETQKEAEKEFIKEELGKLGPNGSEIVDQIQKWGRNNLPEELHKTFHDMAYDSNAMKVFDVIRKMHGGSSVPDSIKSNNPTVSREELMKMMDTPEYEENGAETKRVDALYRQLLG